jgi:hypothetical protein
MTTKETTMRDDEMRRRLYGRGTGIGERVGVIGAMRAEWAALLVTYAEADDAGAFDEVRRVWDLQDALVARAACVWGVPLDVAQDVLEGSMELGEVAA